MSLSYSKTFNITPREEPGNKANELEISGAGDKV